MRLVQETRNETHGGTWHTKEIDDFDLKDLDPTRVEYESGRIQFESTERRQRVRRREFKFSGADELYGTTTEQTSYIWMDVNPTMDDFEKRIANAFAHAIKLSGGKREANDDAFK